MAFDFKKAYKEFYMPKNTPEIVTVPKANYIAVRGKGNPNEEGGAYQQAVGILYAIAYTLKMSYKSDYKIEGFFEYVVPPLEGFWWQDGVDGVDYTDKSTFNWISVIRLPDFVTKADFDWAVAEATRKKKLDCSMAEFLSVDELEKAMADGTLEEAWGCGTAAVVSPIGELCYKDVKYPINNGEIGEVTQMLYDTLTGIQWGKIEDTYGWTKEI